MNSVAPNNREKEIFEQALDRESGGERQTFVQAACGADAALCARVLALLAAHETDAGFLPDPPEATRFVLPVTEKPGDRIGRYKLLQQIGEGGCGVVYMAEQEEPVRRRVALKVIKLGMDTKSVIARFEAERQALALMDHPNIAKVLDAGATETGRPYFVMELVRGIKITDYCDQNNLSTRERLDLFIQVCHAIQHAHQKGIIHRDIKPSNILVTVNDGTPMPKVIDFGIAKATEQRLTDKTLFTAFEQFIGTPAYMSPEQAEMTSLDIDTRSDVYALGVLLYELLTGKTPFDSKTLVAAGVEEMRRIIREQEPARPSTRLNTLQGEELTTTAKRRGTEAPKLFHLVQGDLDWIVMKCLEKDRTRRYETANGLAQDIERHLNSEPVEACPPSTAYKIQKFVRRNRVMVGATGAVALALVGGIIVSSWLAVWAMRAKREESIQRQRAEEESDKAKRAGESEELQRLQAQRHLYAAKMNLAQQAWEQNNIARLRQLLVETRESPDRGFEWYYWQRQAHLALKTLRGHLVQVTGVAFSPDGQRIVAGDYFGTVKIWEVASGRELLTFIGHSAVILSVAFSPDGRRVITGSWDKTAKVWDASTGRELLTLAGHHDQVWSVAISPDSQRIATGSWDRTAKVWDAANGRELLELKPEKSGGVRTVAFSPDSQRIVTGDYNWIATVWDAVNGRVLVALTGHSNSVTSAAFSPDGQRIVTSSGSTDPTARVWDANSGRELLKLTGHATMLWSVAFSPDGQRIATAGQDFARVWDANTGQALLTFAENIGPFVSLAFSPDGRFLVTSGEDRTAKVWEAVAGRNPLTLAGHSAWIGSASFSPDGRRVVTGSADHTARVWDSASGSNLIQLTGHHGPIRSATFSSDGHRIVTGSWDQTAKVWDPASGSNLFTLTGHNAWTWSAAFSPDSQQIVTGSADKTAKVWNVTNGQELFTLKGHTGPVGAVAFSLDGQRIVTGSSDNTARVWNTVNGQQLLVLTNHTQPVWSVAFSPDGTRIITASGDKTAKVWNATNGQELLTLKGHSDELRSATFSPDGQRLVTGSLDTTARVWESLNGQELLTLKGHNGAVLSAAFSPDGRRIVTCGDDLTARVWMAGHSEQITAWQEEDQAASQLAVELDRALKAELERRRIAIADDEGAIKRWLVLAPIPLAPGQSTAEGVAVEQIEGEKRLRPKAGETRSFVGGTLKWLAVDLKDHVMDLNEILGHETDWCVAYAACYIKAQTEQRGLRLLVSADDQAKVYLNGELVYQYLFPRFFFADQDMVPDITLKEGINVLVFKVVNQRLAWGGSIRFTDGAGQPVKGIRVLLDPEGQDLP
jgi:eukaryotic-like serine/threonine-protein kinase